MMKYIILFVLFTLSNNVISENTDSFSSNVEIILKEMGTWTVPAFAPYIIYDSNKFVELSNSSCKYLEGAKTFSNNRIDSDKKELITAYLMYKLPLGEYANWMEYVYRLYINKKVGDVFFEFVVFPSISDRPDLYLSFNNKKIVELYHMLIKSKQVSDKHKKNIKSILQGEQAEFINSYYPDNKIPLPVIEINKFCNKPRAN